DPVGPATGLINQAFFDSCFGAPMDDGILGQQSESPLVLLDLIKDIRTGQGKADFDSIRTQHYAHPSSRTGWWSCTLARKGGRGFDFREADATAKAFPTRYYSTGIHKAAQVLPPFVAEALG